MECPKCNSEMIEGCLTDHLRPSYVCAQWIDGPREEGAYGLETKDRLFWKVDGYRCQSCGYLELYGKKRDYP